MEKFPCLFFVGVVLVLVIVTAGTLMLKFVLVFVFVLMFVHGKTSPQAATCSRIC